MKFVIKRILPGVLISLLVYAAVVAGLVVFGTAKPPAAAPAITEPFASIDVQNLPGLRRYQARDGAALSYREYDATGTQMAVLIHGSAGSSVDMHPLALALQKIGVSVLVPDIRGHGANRPHGDIHYVGQLDDDLADFIALQKPDHPNSKWTLLGFSSGAAFALRISAEAPLGRTMDRYVFVSPYLRYNAPSVRQSASATGSGKSGADTKPTQTWAAVSLGRIIGLTILNQFGIHGWDDLPVLAFPVPDNIESVTKAYT
jgi:alpha-beta hydrolase superfamily lysophospholipase